MDISTCKIAINIWSLPKVRKYHKVSIYNWGSDFRASVLNQKNRKPSKNDHFLERNRLILVRRRPPVQTRASTTATAPNVSLHSVECRKNKKFTPDSFFDGLAAPKSSEIHENHENPLISCQEAPPGPNAR